MKIQAITGFRTGQNNFNLNSKISNTPSCSSFEYKLPNYELSFGMAKIKHVDKHYDENLDPLIKKDISKEMRKISNNTGIYGGKSNEYNEPRRYAIRNLVKKYANNKLALKYIFFCSDIDNTPAGKEMAVSYLKEIQNSASKEEIQSGELVEFLSEILCDTKNRTGKTIPQIFAHNAEALEDIFSATKQHHYVLYDILTNRDSKGNALADDIAAKHSVASVKLLNETIYNLAVADRKIEKFRAIELLSTNEFILDDKNIDALYTLLVESY